MGQWRRCVSGGGVCDVRQPLSHLRVAFVMSQDHRIFPEPQCVRDSMQTQGECATYVVE